MGLGGLSCEVELNGAFCLKSQRAGGGVCESEKSFSKKIRGLLPSRVHITRSFGEGSLCGVCLFRKACVSSPKTHDS